MSGTESTIDVYAAEAGVVMAQRPAAMAPGAVLPVEVRMNIAAARDLVERLNAAIVEHGVLYSGFTTGATA